MNKIMLILLISIHIYAQPILIGRLDKIDLPTFNLHDIKAKIDTGAKTSSLHVTYIQQLENGMVSFKVLDTRHPQYKEKIFTLPIKRIANIKSSNGQSEKRYVIETKVKIFQQLYNVEFSLSNRSKMNYPILLGREFLNNGFIVDVQKKDLSYKLKQQ